ncbi:AlbA family DNA-binding domain-containing protein [Sunxiuqinia rutila]|uniref:AlbA family DNA-binding domain-containing protein n=1 Tax=Sunxiuqinia rutila TaxID=1397841 RepID=UPI003D36793F
MYLLGIRADKINESDIKRLIDNQIQENKSLDYKRDLNLSTDKDKKEFLFDLTAMYNTDGGCLIFGIEEEKDEKKQNTGKPLKIVGIELENSDKLIQRIEDIIKNSTEPSISQVIINIVEVELKKILIVGIPKGLGLPAMVTFNQTNKFYRRRNSGKFAVDVYELNQMFMQNQILKEKVIDFRKDRIKKVLACESLPNLKVDNAFFIHIIPYGFLDYNILDFTTAENNLTLKMRPIYSNGWDKMYNIDGFATFSSTAHYQITSYNQIFRNGIYEMYTSELFYETSKNKRMGFDGDDFIQEVIENIKEALFVLNQMKVEPPFLISYSFHNVKGYIVDSYITRRLTEFKQNEILFPFIQIPSYESDIYKLLKPNFDILWQSLGLAKSPEMKMK